MPIKCVCAACFRESFVPRAYIGKRARCRACGHVQRILSPDAPPDPSGYALAPGPSVPIPPPHIRSEPTPRSKTHGARWSAIHELEIFQESQVQGFACGLLALSAADLFMTFTLLRTSPAFFESNPVAQWFFARWNIAGMAMFKFSMIGLVIALSEFIERRRPGWGRFVLLTGCCGAAYAVYKGFNLYMGHDDHPSVGDE